MSPDPLLELMPVHLRLALSYAPVRTRALTLGLFALDCRLAGIVRGTREPLLGQVKLAWWRDRLGEKAEAWPEGEPVLAALRLWGAETGALSAMVDGWEGLLGEPLDGDALERFADGRASAFGALARLLQADPDEAMRAARGWALVDLSGKLGDPSERSVAQELADQLDWQRCRLPRSLRPLAILHGLARRAMLRGEGELLAGGTAGLVALRLGLLGR